jgi:hypothetical protein
MLKLMMMMLPAVMAGAPPAVVNVQTFAFSL